MQLVELISIEKLRPILERLHNSIQMGCCIVDPSGGILIEKGWRCLCKEVQPEFRSDRLRCCIEEQYFFTGRMQSGEKWHIFTCENGISCIVAPIIIDHLHIANIIIGIFTIEPHPFGDERSCPAMLGQNIDVAASKSSIPNYSVEKVQQISGQLELLVDLITEIGRNYILEKQRHADLKKNEVHLRNLVDSLPQVVFETDRDGLVTFFNMSAFEILGYTQEQLERGIYKSMFIPANEQSRLNERFKRILQGKIVSSVECTMRRSNGQLFDALLSSRPIYDGNDNVVGVRGFVLDMSKHSQAKRELWESEQRYRLLFENSHDAILLAEDLKIIDCNTKAAELLLLSREELLGMEIYSLFETLNSKQGKQLIELIRRGLGQGPGMEKSLDWEFSRRDGQLIETEIFLDMLELSGRRFMQMTIHDVTREHHNQRLLRSRQDAWDALFQHAPFGITINRLEDGVYLDVNPALEKFTGRNAKELIGKPAIQFLPTDQHAQANSVVTALLDKGYSGLQEAEVMRKDGAKGYVYYSAATFQSGNETNIVSMVVDITDRRKIEKRLEQSEAKLNSLFQAVPVGIAILKDRFFLAANETLALITGYKIDELLGSDSKKLYFNNQEYLATGRVLYNQMPDGGRGYAETRFRHHDGSARYISLYSAPLDPDDFDAGYAVAVQDITAQKQVVKALEESEVRYRSLFEAAGDAIFIMKDGLLVDCNSKALDIFSCERDAILGKTPAELSPVRQADGSDSAVSAQRLLDDVMSGKTVNTEWTQLRPDGSTFEAEVSLSTVELSGDRAIQAIVRDISERKKNDKILRDNEFRFRSFFHTNPEGIMLIDFQGKILDANKAFQKRSGYDFTELQGVDLKVLVSEDEQETVMKSLVNLKSGIRTPDGLRINYISKSGEPVPVDVRSWVVMDEASNPLYFGVFIRDLTKEIKLSEEKVALEKQVIRAQKSEAIGTLASGIAHDFNNILGGIIGYTELALLRDPSTLDGKTGEYLKRVLEGSNRAKGLVQQILRFSRNSDTVMEPIRLLPLLEETILLLQSTIPSTITIDQQFMAEQDKILGDSNQIHQIIMNLATNAYHAMQDAGGTLSIRMDNTTLAYEKQFMSMTIPPGEYIKITVSDTGCGMTPAVLDRMFEPYYTTKKVNQGTGLGMAVVLGIIKSHKGLIAVDTAPGQGSVFEVYLPVTVDKALGDVESEDDVFPLTGKGQRILIVDDEAYFLEVVEESLLNLGYLVTSCRSSVEALQAFRNSPDSYDLLVTDQTMPDMTGVQLTQKIRMIRDSFPVILCTGFSEVVTEQSADYYGINRFLMKPVSVNDLAAAVAELLSEYAEE